MTKLACPSEDRLLALVNGKLAHETTAELNRHIGDCPRCASAVAQLCGNAFAQRAANLDGNRPTTPPKNATPTFASAVDATLSPKDGSEVGPARGGNEWNFLSPSVQADELGRLGNYRILKVLGRGGMGLVFQAEDPTLGRLCALKVMLPELAQRPEMKERFIREARAAALIEHDNIVPIYQVGEDRGLPFIAMPFLKGASLEDWLEKKGNRRQNGAAGKPIAVAQILKLGREIAKGLAAAHERGLVHRDIKPDNIWLDATTGGRVKILDFGLARLNQSDREAASDKKNLTRTGMIIGTPAYMAPEQAQGKMEEIDGRADLFSLGCILYRMCTGRTPFDGDDMISTLVSVAVDQPAPPIQLNPETPPALSALVMKLLEKDRNYRPASASEVQSTLQTIEKEFRSTPTQPADLGAIVDPKAIQTEFEALTATTEPAADSGSPREMSDYRRTANDRSFFDRYRWPLVAIGAAFFGMAAIVLAGVVLLWETPKGTVRIEITDPDIKVAIDKDDFKIQGADRHDIVLRTGQHGLRVKRGDFEFETDKFVLKKGDEITLKVEVIPGRVRVVQGDRVIGEKPLPAALDRRPLQSKPLDKPATGDSSNSQASKNPVVQTSPASPKRSDTLPPKIGNHLGMSFSLVPKGKAWLGGAAGKPGTTLVEMPYDFYLGTYEVTQDEWQNLMGVNPSFFAANWGKDHLRDVAPIDFKRFPVERVSRDEALLFIARLNEKDKQAGWVYRLPGPAEWEYACRGGPMKDQSESAFDYYFDKPTNQLTEHDANFGGNEGHTVKVGSYKPNRLGLYDMHGNVSEWCENAGGGRGARGGSWNDTAGNCRAMRGGGGRLVRALNTHGLRVARVPVDARPPLLPDDKTDP